MSSAVPTSMFESQLKTQAKQTRGMHERAARIVEVHVIRGGLMSEQAPPRHTRAVLLDGLRGASFGLSPRERVCAWVFGTLFILAALAAAVW